MVSILKDFYVMAVVRKISRLVLLNAITTDRSIPIANATSVCATSL